MNEPERKILYLALALFALGLLYRFIPWEAPAISRQEDYSNVEYGTEVFRERLPAKSPPAVVTDKVTETDGRAEKDKKPKSSQKRKKTPKLPVHINRAGAEEICALKGVGPKLAEKIVDFRAKNGPFSGPSDLEKVPGIGKKKLEGLLQGVNFD